MDFRDRSRSPRGGADDDVLSLIFQREQARFSKDFASADQLRDRLQQLGVTLFDKTNSWRSNDGRSGRIPSWADIEAGQTPETLMMTVATKGPMMPIHDGDGPEGHIKSLVQQREQARAAKDFAKSDQLRDELKSMGVELFDKEKLWRSKSGQSGVIIGYRGAGPADIEISTLVVQREKARQSGDYGTSDMIRDELKSFNVMIDDKAKMWRGPDGRQGPVPSWDQILAGMDGSAPQMAMQMHMPMASMHRSAPMVGAPGDVRQQLLQAALQAASNPAMAARTLQLLQQAGVAGPPPRGSSGFHTTIPGPAQYNQPAQMMSASMPRSPEANDAIAFIQQAQASGRSPSEGEIEWLVSTREKIRQAKDFSTSDELRNLMRSSLGIELHEKEKRWNTSDGRQGSIPSWAAIG